MSNTEEIRFIDLFAGVGGFRYGLEQCNNGTQKNIGENGGVGEWLEKENELYTGQQLRKRFNCVYSNEWNKYANSVYRKHYGECDDRDIRNVKSEDIPEFDLLCGGFPCQSFSIAGKRGGFNDTRGTMFFEIARILRDKRPRYLLLENVKGLLTHDNGKTFQTILGVLADIGYDVQWQVLNSKNFGVPQNRERVFIVGHLRGTSRPEVFPITRTNQKTLEYVGGILSEKSKKWLDDGKIFSRNFPQGSRVYKDTGISATLASQAGGLGAKTGLYQVQGNNSDRVLKKIDKVGALKSTNQNNPQSGGTTLVMPVLTPDRIEKRQNGRRFKENGDPSFTLTAQDKHGVLLSRTIRTGGRGSTDEKHRWDIINDGIQIRRLTPIECERLQGFPNNWTQTGIESEKISDTQRYRMMGNAVTTKVIQAIGEKLCIN